jgi:hypothetical protein
LRIQCRVCLGQSCLVSAQHHFRFAETKGPLPISAGPFRANSGFDNYAASNRLANILSIRLPSRSTISNRHPLASILSGQTPDIRQLVRDGPIIPETVDALDVVAMLRDSPVHMGLIHDEYGTFQGVVTRADILGAIVGSFHTEHGAPESAFVRRRKCDPEQFCKFKRWHPARY